MNTQYNDPKGAAGAVKVPLGLIPPHAMEQTAWVHKLGADKYGPWNWRETGVCASTYVNAILRHLNAWRDGEDLDPESGISHLAHIACSANILMDARYCSKLQDDRNKAQKHVGGGMSYEKDWGALDELDELDEEDALAEFVENMWRELDKELVYRILKYGEVVQDGDEVYLSEGHWCPVYVASWATPSIVRDGTYRRKITDCDESCDSKPEPQLKVADCDLEEECKCGRRYVYHWLYGWICEDCDLKLSDYYP